VPVPDVRLDQVAAVAGSPKVVPTQLEVVDIAGLVRGASRGEGLGNRFLGAIREVDAILHLVRCFEAGGVAHVEDRVDPVRDIELVETELLLADIASLERRLDGLAKRARGGDPDAQDQLELIERILPQMQSGRPARVLEVAPPHQAIMRTLQLLSAKPILYVCNVDEASAAHGN
jgi:ribosome-binding ATPase